MTRSVVKIWTTQLHGRTVVVTERYGPAPRKRWEDVPGPDDVDYGVAREAPVAEESQCLASGLAGVLLLALLMTAAVMVASAAVRCPA